MGRVGRYVGLLMCGLASSFNLPFRLRVIIAALAAAVVMLVVVVGIIIKAVIISMVVLVIRNCLPARCCCCYIFSFSDASLLPVRQMALVLISYSPVCCQFTANQPSHLLTPSTTTALRRFSVLVCLTIDLLPAVYVRCHNCLVLWHVLRRSPNYWLSCEY